MLWGTWTDKHRTGDQPPWDMSAVDEVESRVGARMSLIHFGTPMTGPDGRNPFPFPAAQMDAIVRRGATPLFSWSTHAMRNYDHPDFSLRAIAEGRQDALIRQWARAAKAWGKPFILRFNWEMNGDWFPWAERYAKSSRKGDYVRAWRRARGIFLDERATNVAWMWCPSYDPDGTEQPLASLYPGDAYVNWTCLDVYNGDNPWRSFTQAARRTYDEIQRIAPTKPMILAEVGSTEAGGDKAAWITEMFASLPRRFPAVRGVVWFDKVERGPGKKTDWALESSKAAERAFGRGLTRPAG
jgi:hypothetical protein